MNKIEKMFIDRSIDLIHQELQFLEECGIDIENEEGLFFDSIVETSSGKIKIKYKRKR